MVSLVRVLDLPSAIPDPGASSTLQMGTFFSLDHEILEKRKGKKSIQKDRRRS